jgi:hypothetical protein
MQVCLLFNMGASIRGRKQSCKYVNPLALLASQFTHLEDKAFDIENTASF